MDDARTRHATDARERRAVPQQRVDECAGKMPGRRMYHHSRRLVDDDQVVIFEDDIKRNRLCFGLGRHRRRNRHDDRGVRGNLLPRLLGDAPVDGDEACLDEPLDP